MTSIRKHLGDFIAIVALFVLAMGIGAYILSNQRLRFPIVEEKPFELKVELPDAQARPRARSRAGAGVTRRASRAACAAWGLMVVRP